MTEPPASIPPRYAGENASDQDCIAKLLEALQNVPDGRRSGRFICAVAIAEPLAQVRVVRGICEGRIIRTPRGGRGFGYDPVFVPVGYDKTFAELGDEIKNQISHRAKALGKSEKVIERNELGEVLRTPYDKSCPKGPHSKSFYTNLRSRYHSTDRARTLRCSQPVR